MEFLLENPFIVVILIGILSSFYKRLKESQSQKKEVANNRPLKPKNFEMAPTTMKPVDEPAKRKRTAKNQQDIQLGKKLKNLENQYKNIKQEVNSKPSQQSKTRAAAKVMENEKSRDQEAANRESKLPVSEQTLVDAIVWSEILGQPRAKNPHTSMKTGRVSGVNRG